MVMICVTVMMHNSNDETIIKLIESMIHEILSYCEVCMLHLASYQQVLKTVPEQWVKRL